MARIRGTRNDDFLFGGDDDDVILGLGGDDSIFAGGGDDRVAGGDGDDFLAGDGGRDQLSGGAGADTLIGDDLPGIADGDTLIGGDGDDAFAWQVVGGGSTSTVQDVVTDFSGAGVDGGDTLELTLDFGDDRFLTYLGRLEGALVNEIAVGAANDGVIAVAYDFDGDDTVVFADSNDNGVFDPEDFAVRLLGRQDLVRADFGDTDFVTFGTARADRIIGDDSDDSIRSLGGADIVSGGLGDDSIYGGAGGDTLQGDDGNDLVDGGGGADFLIGGAGRDRLLGGGDDDRIEGGSGADSLAGFGGDDVVLGGAGGDTIDGDAGDDQLFGENGADTIFGQEGDDLIAGGDGDDELFGDEGSDRLEGGTGNDELEGDFGADTLVGSEGNDRFIFFLGSFNPSSPFRIQDTILDFEGAGAAGGDVIDLSGGAFIFGGFTQFDPQEGALLPGGGDGSVQLFYTHSDGDTVLVADENDNGILDRSDFTLRISGIHALTEDDFTDTIFITGGTAGADTLTGDNRDDRIAGLGGDDRIFGRGGDDTLEGGTGNDLVKGGRGFDSLFGGDGDDTLVLGEFGSASGGAGDDRLFGSDTQGSFNTLSGDAGRDELRAGAGGARLEGGDGGDLLFGGVGGDSLNGGAGRDLFVFGPVWGDDFIDDLEDGVEQIDLRASGLAFEDLAIESISPSQTRVTSTAGSITIFQPVEAITVADFIFG